MRLIMTLALGLIALTVSSNATAEAGGSFTLPYKGENRWVASNDGKDLRTLIKTARKKKATHFYVQLPEEGRTASIERLIVLRDILEKNLKSGITLEEVDGTPEANTLAVKIK